MGLDTRLNLRLGCYLPRLAGCRALLGRRCPLGLLRLCKSPLLPKSTANCATDISSIAPTLLSHPTPLGQIRPLETLENTLKHDDLKIGSLRSLPTTDAFTHLIDVHFGASQTLQFVHSPKLSLRHSFLRSRTPAFPRPSRRWCTLLLVFLLLLFH